MRISGKISTICPYCKSENSVKIEQIKHATYFVYCDHGKGCGKTYMASVYTKVSTEIEIYTAEDYKSL